MTSPIEQYRARVRHASALAIRAGVTVIILAGIVEAYIELVGSTEGAAEAGVIVGLVGPRRAGPSV